MWLLRSMTSIKGGYQFYLDVRIFSWLHRIEAWNGRHESWKARDPIHQC